MKIEKIIGWLLIFVGLSVIGWTMYQSYSIFTAKIPVPEIFQLEKTQEETDAYGKAKLSPEEEMGKMFQEQLKEALPIDFLPKLFNLISWSILAIILFWGGAQVSGIGVKLLK